MIDLSTVNSTVIGISFLGDDDFQQMCKLWDDRFAKSEAIITQASLADTVDQIQEEVLSNIRNNKIPDMTGKSCIVVLFLDSRNEELDEDTIDKIERLSARIQNALFCTIQIELQFVLCGTNPVVGADQIKQRTLLLSKKNTDAASINRRICLIAKTLVNPNDLTAWRSAIIYLDVLRRSTDLNSVFPAVGASGNNDVCYLAFSEYNEKERQKKEEDIRKLNDYLGAGHKDELIQLITKKLCELDNRVPVLDANAQPLHPDLFVNGIIQRKKAQHGHNQVFNNARVMTQAALHETYRRFVKDTEELFDSASACGADCSLLVLLKEAQVGLELRCDPAKIKEILPKAGDAGVQPQMPSLTYNESGYREEIDKYFKGVRDYAIQAAHRKFAQNLIDQCEKINVDERKKEKEEVGKKLSDEKNVLAGMPDEAGFLNMVTASLALPASFHPGMPGGSTTKVLIDLDANTAERHDKNVAGCNIAYLPKEQMLLADDAETKAFHVLDFDCDKARLDDLIKEAQA